MTLRTPIITWNILGYVLSVSLSQLDCLVQSIYSNIRTSTKKKMTTLKCVKGLCSLHSFPGSTTFSFGQLS